MKGLLVNWNLMRALRLVLGIIVIVQGVNNGEALYYVLGGMLVLMAGANAGCCGAGGCTIDTRKGKPAEEKKIV